MSASSERHQPLPHQHKSQSQLEQSCPACRADRRKEAATKQKTPITRKPCARCKEMRWVGGGVLCLSCLLADANAAFSKMNEALPKPAPLPEISQAEPVRGLKAAVLVVTGSQHDPQVRFQGTGMSALYDAEAVARCLNNQSHAVPDPACSCGFWVPVKVKDVQPPTCPGWLLDVELAGRVVECAPDGEPVKGWRGSHQRVLAVTASRWCQLCPSTQAVPGRYLVVLTPQYARQDEERPAGILAVACVRHAAAGAIPFPVTWLRERLGTEVQPGFLVNDEAVVPASVVSAEDQALADRLASLTGADVPGTKALPVSPPSYNPGRIIPQPPLYTPSVTTNYPRPPLPPSSTSTWSYKITPSGVDWAQYWPRQP